MTYDPTAAAEKQVRRSQAASTDYVKGVMNVKEAPTQKAKRKKEKYRTGVLAALDSGKWEAGLDATTLDDWQKAAAGKGGDRYGAGVEAAKDKIGAFHQEFASFMSTHQARIDALPDTTPEQRLQKMVENAKGIAKFQRRRTRR